MRKKSPKAIRSVLKELTNGSKTYDSAYDNAMQRIEDQVADQKEMAWEVLSWITCAKRPLTTIEIQNALAVELGESDLDGDNLPDLDDIISACAGLVTVTVGASSSVIRLVHYTAQEYFQRTWTRWFPDAHKSIATTCVTYLSFNAFRAGICNTDTEFEARLAEYPLYSYAARNWGHHAWMQLVSEDILIAFLEDTPKVDACVQAAFVQKGFTSLGDYSPRVPLSFTALHLAAYFGLARTVSSLIQHCDQSHLKDSMGRTPLAWAAYTGHDSIVKFFLDNGVNACERDGDGRTPISLAASMGWVGVVNVLLEYHIDPDSRDVDDQTPLSWAAYRGHEEVVRLLLEKGANPDSKDENGQTPLFWAASNGWVRLVALLLEQLVDPDPKDMHGRTPVSYAAENGDYAVVELLLEKGTKPDSKDIEAHSPLFWAAHYGHKGVHSLLQAKSAGQNPYVPMMDGTDCVMENTFEKESAESHPNTFSHPPWLNPKIAPCERPTRQFIFKCPLCSGDQMEMFKNRAALRRHIDNHHYPRFIWRCTEPPCSDGVNYKLLGPRRDHVAEHFRSVHNRKIIVKDQIREALPQPTRCPICQTLISSWAEFEQCVLSHCPPLPPSSEAP